jgi:hypothetical protein
VYTGAVFIAVWQMEQQIRNLANAKRIHLVDKFWAYAMQIL